MHRKRLGKAQRFQLVHFPDRCLMLTNASGAPSAKAIPAEGELQVFEKLAQAAPMLGRVPGQCSGYPTTPSSRWACPDVRIWTGGGWQWPAR